MREHGFPRPEHYCDFFSQCSRIKKKQWLTLNRYIDIRCQDMQNHTMAYMDLPYSALRYSHWCFRWNIMRVDSCRNCGNQISVKKHCKVCHQPVQLQCENCQKFLDDPVHSICSQTQERHLEEMTGNVVDSRPSMWSRFSIILFYKHICNAHFSYCDSKIACHKVQSIPIILIVLLYSWVKHS